MREILFRGKQKVNGEWIEGHFGIKGKCLTSNPTHWIMKSTLANNCDCVYFTDYEVIPKTIGQYTGLTDKNGKKVFEGDILKFTDKFSNYEWIGKVEFGNPNAEYSWGFQLVFVSGAKPNTDILLWFEMEETGAFSEVIGNIHDNPELLKECEG